MEKGREMAEKRIARNSAKVLHLNDSLASLTVATVEKEEAVL
jgi:hypothetical protein